MNMDVIRETQREAWDSIQDTLGDAQQLVLEKIVEQPRTAFQVSEVLGWPINRVSGRITELTKKGKIIDSGCRRVNPDSGRNVIVWKLAA